MLEEFILFYYVCPKYFFFFPPIFPFFLGGRKVSKHVELWAKNALEIEAISWFQHNKVDC
jgi:hypothetical protein